MKGLRRFVSTHRARVALTDTALMPADSPYAPPSPPPTSGSRTRRCSGFAARRALDRDRRHPNSGDLGSHLSQPATTDSVEQPPVPRRTRGGHVIPDIRL